MDRTKWFFHPAAIFVFSIVALAASLVLYIYWYIEVSSGLKAVIYKFNLDSREIFAPQTWLVILVLSILVGIILAGTFIIFVFYQKSIQLYRMQRNFINNFTHELKTPVTSLNLYLETFLRHELSREDQIKYLRFMIQDVKRLADNTNRILNLARIESKSFSGEFVLSDLVDVVERFCTDNAHLFPGCDIKIHNSSGRSFFYGINPSLFEMLVMNLLKNAVAYNRSDVPRVDIDFTQQGRKLHISFKDNGIGIDRRHLKKIFKKFYQVGRSDNMTARGSGIGLYLVESIARIHKGAVIAGGGGAGGGSTFTLILPLKRQLQSKEARHEPSR
ncbi:MAG: HAMP domain-containing histidine kinase [Deltaproteobacteria bacterium]|nr:HAMP domain-containing histidine kinase [Deltaproteobacteria bacterium]